MTNYVNFLLFQNLVISSWSNFYLSFFFNFKFKIKYFMYSEEVNQAKEILKKNGYYVDHLYNIDEIRSELPEGKVLSDEELYRLVEETFNNIEHIIWDEIQDQIEIHFDE